MGGKEKEEEEKEEEEKGEENKGEEKKGVEEQEKKIFPTCTHHPIILRPSPTSRAAFFGGVG